MRVVQKPLNHRGELGGGVCLELPLALVNGEAETENRD